MYNCRCVSVISSFLLILTIAAHAAELPLWIDGAVLRPGEVRRVAVRLGDGIQAMALSLDAELWFAPDGVAVTAVEVSPALAACAVGSAVDAAAAAAGTVRVAVACVAPRKMAGPLLWLTVRGVKPGASLLSVRRCQIEALRGDRSVELGCAGYGGRVMVRAVG